MSDLPGFKYQGKKGGERYKVTPSVRKRLEKQGVKVKGDGTISKRQYRNAQLKREGWQSLSERERLTQPKAAAKNPVAQAKVRQHRKAIEAFAKERGISIREASKHGSDLELALTEARASGYDKTYGGALHRYLQLQGKSLVEKDDGSFGSP